MAVDWKDLEAYSGGYTVGGELFVRRGPTITSLGKLGPMGFVPSEEGHELLTAMANGEPAPELVPAGPRMELVPDNEAPAPSEPAEPEAPAPVDPDDHEQTVAELLK